MKKKIFDCFLYDGEKELLKLRLLYNLKYVYKFILVQSEVSFQGDLSKDNLINIKEILKWDAKLKDKLELITLKKEDFINIKFPYERELISRSAFSLCYKYANLNDIILLSDVDEIIDIRKLLSQNLSNKYIYNLGLYFSYFSCNYICLSNPWWSAPMAIPYFLIKKFSLEISTLRAAGSSISSLPSNIKKRRIYYMGIHLSFLGGYHAAIKKLNRYSDTPIDIKTFTKDKYNNSIKEGTDIFGRNLKWERVNMKNLLLEKELIIKIKKEPFLNNDFYTNDIKKINLFNVYFWLFSLTNNLIFRKILFLIFNFLLKVTKNKMFNSLFTILNKILNYFKFFR